MTASTTHRHTPRMSGRIALAAAVAAIAVSVAVIAAASPHIAASPVPGRPSLDLDALRTEARLYEGTSLGIDIDDLVDMSRLEAMRTEARLYEGTSLGLDVDDLVDMSRLEAMRTEARLFQGTSLGLDVDDLVVPAPGALPKRSKAVDRR